MAEKRKREISTDSGNRPFSQLAALIRKAGIELHAGEMPAEKGREATPAQQAPETAPESDEQVFEQAMESVPRISWRRDPTPTFMPPPAARVESESEDARLLQEALDSGDTPPILDHPEYIEGWVGLAGRRFLPNLRNGIYSIQGYIDLHGLSRVEAREAVEEFITRMSRQGSCCVKIIHGRGINSPSDKAVLKEHLQRWLATRRMSHHVVAYASAPFSDGGVGAIYVLLRRVQRYT